jgi:hypothetical protein
LFVLYFVGNRCTGKSQNSSNDQEQSDPEHHNRGGNGVLVWRTGMMLRATVRKYCERFFILIAPIVCDTTHDSVKHSPRAKQISPKPMLVRQTAVNEKPGVAFIRRSDPASITVHYIRLGRAPRIEMAAARRIWIAK